MTAIEQAQALQQQAIAILLAEREAIDQQLAMLGHGQIKAPTQKRRGRPLKQPISQPESSQPVLIS